MANLRIIYNNALDRAATLTADTTAGSLVAANMLTEQKSEVWRSTSTSATITMTWSKAESSAAVILPYCNLTSTATVRVRGYTLTTDTTAAFDTGAVQASPGPFFSNTADWGTLPLGANAFQQQTGVNKFAYGGGSYAYVWFAATYQVTKLVIDIVDTANQSGYVELARIVTGHYWTPVVNAEYGSVSIGLDETSTHERSDAGDLRTERGVMSRNLTFGLTYMTADDRDHLWRILRTNGMSKPMYVSISPQSSDVGDEQIFMIYGKLAKQSVIQYTYMNQYANTVQIEEI